jgi:hypothetical protein
MYHSAFLILSIFSVCKTGSLNIEQRRLFYGIVSPNVSFDFGVHGRLP